LTGQTSEVRRAALVEQIADVLVSALDEWPKDFVEAIESIPDDGPGWLVAVDHARRTRDAEAALAVLEQSGYGDALRAEVDSLSIRLDQAHALLHEVAVARRGDHPDVDTEPEELPDEIRAAQRAWNQEHERADVLEAEVARLRAGGWRDLLPSPLLSQLDHVLADLAQARAERDEQATHRGAFEANLQAVRARVLAVARDGEHGASRREEPLDVPSWVSRVREAVGAPDDRCPCTQCQGADERRARYRGDRS
jgi:hypothetical protein